MPDNPISIEAFRDFCASKPADERYRYVSFNCACAQFAKSVGVKFAPFGRWDKLDRIASVHPYTFGALTARLSARLGG